MKSARILRPLIVSLLVLLCLVTFATAARADIIDDIASVLDELGPANPYYSQGVTGPNLRQAKGFFQCLNAGSDPIDCIHNLQGTELGNKVSAEADLPSWFWDLIDLYIAFKNHDYWGVVANLGEAAACIVAQYFTTVDVCGLVEQLINLANEMYDAAAAVVEFFGDVGKAILGVAEDIYCGIFGCDDDEPPPPPPEALAYSTYFLPAQTQPPGYSQGLQAIEAKADNAYFTLENQLRKSAAAQFGDGAASIAAQKFRQAIDDQWTGHLVATVLQSLGSKRNQYNNPGQVKALANTAGAAVKNSLADPKETVTGQCRKDFYDEFHHVDRWISRHKAKAENELKVKSNSQWCDGTLWEGNHGRFSTEFRAYAKANFCPESGQKLYCATTENYERCLKLLGSVGEQQQCNINAAAMGKDAAEEIRQALLARGSTGQYTIVSPPLGLGAKPTNLVCQRPPQQHACTEEYQKRFGTYPVKLVTCTLNEPADYAALRVAVAQAVASLNGVKSVGQYQMQTNLGGADFAIDTIDPLLVWPISNEAFDQAQNDNKSFGFKPPATKPGFEFQLFKQKPKVDGVATPTISAGKELHIKPPLTKANMKEKLGPKNPGDPIDQLKQKQDLTKNVLPVASQSALTKENVAAKASVTTLTTASSTFTAAVHNAAQGPAMPGGQQAMSGKLPAGSNVTVATAAKLGQTAPTPATTTPQATPMSLQYADLTAADTVTIAGKTGKQTVAWNTPVTLDAKDAVSTANGLCTFTAQYALRNLAKGAAGPFKSVWSNSATMQTVEHIWPGIAPNASSAPTIDTISLKPGQNLLTLDIDKTGQVKEGNELNNQFKLPVTLNGSCSQTKPILPVKR